MISLLLHTGPDSQVVPHKVQDFVLEVGLWKAVPNLRFPELENTASLLLHKNLVLRACHQD
jgi:hypothetical protein